MKHTMSRNGQVGDTLVAWLEVLCPKSMLTDQEVTEQIARDSLQLASLERNGDACPGIVVLEQVTPEICDFIAEASRNGIGRILVLVTDRAALAGDYAWQLLRAGASDVLVWRELANPGGVIASRLRRWREVDRVLESPLVKDNLVGQSRAWRSALRQLMEVAHYTDAPVLLMGETGTGKELAARLVHTLDAKRTDHELVILDCTTIVPDLSGSELFGHEKGAFTGAVSARDGAFAMADGGTVFLDEVGELPAGLQVQLLRVLQEQTYKRVGSNTWRRSDFRLICATNRDLQEEVDGGRFRRDLFYRIASHTIRLPALRERVEDIRALVCHFLGQAQPGQEIPQVDEQVWRYFLERRYPGNVRDLRNLVLRIMTHHVGPGPITVGDIPAEEWPRSGGVGDHWCDSALEQAVRRALDTGVDLRQIKRQAENTAIRLVIEEEDGNLQAAAARLGVTDRTLQNWRARKRQQMETWASG